jgi:hypothetical protein
VKHVAWFSLLLVGCAPTVDGLCEDLADECSAHEAYEIDTQKCMDNGDRLESDADDADCNDEFDTYLDCVDEQRCAWNTACVIQRAEFDHCVNNAE